MRKLFLSLILTTIFVQMSYAQVSVKPLKTRFGFKAGVNLANVNIKSSGITFSPSTLVAPVGGVFVTLPIGIAGFQIQPELLYSGQGYKIDGTGGGKGNNNYVVLPVLAKYSILSTGLALYAGPQFGYLVSAKITPQGGTSADVKADYKSTDVAGVAGLEYNFPMGLNLSGRYQFGLSNISKDESVDGTLKNKSITFTLGFSIK